MLSLPLTEDDLRAFNMCPRYLSFGGKAIWPDNVRLLKLTTERILAESIRNDRLDLTMRFMKSLLKSSNELKLNERYMDSQVNEIVSKVGLALREVFDSFGSNNFIPVFGPAPWRVHVSKSVIQLAISGILREKTQTLHVIDFTPFNEMHGIKNDPVLYLKTKTMMQFVRPWFTGRPQCIMHVFSLNTNHNIIYHKMNSEDITDNSLHRIENMVRAIESKVSFPVLPCKVKCPFKTQCFLD